MEVISSTSSSMNKSQEKYILAFGDSLTRGYYNRGNTKYKPYSIELNRLFQENGENFKVLEKGVNAETTVKMLDRIKKYFGDYEGEKDICEDSDVKINFSLVIIFAGTNDLGSVSAEKIAEDIISLNKYVITKNVPTLLITLPENQCDEIYYYYSEKRTKLNEKVKELAKDIKNIYICDLAENTKFKYKSLAKEERELLWDDQLHFTAQGYDLLGQVIYETIKQQGILENL
jgi:lysophospholipase L1-like esterase